MSASPTPLASPRFAHLLDGLTPDQITAVTHGTGPQVIFAGPGAGKTRTLITRVRYLLATGRAVARDILLVTFTNNAARECAERLERAVGRDAVAAMTICTFHALCARILRTHAELIGRTTGFTIYDERALRELLEEILEDKERPTVVAARQGRARCKVKEIAAEISLAKNRLWTPEFYARNSRHEHAPLIAAAWAQLDRELEISVAAGFDDLLLLTVRLLGDHPELQRHYRRRWRWLLVDEVQDTCYAQMGLLRQLAEPGGNLTICGDLDQALYGFRGAEPANLLSFSTLFPTRRKVTLAVNFRSHAEIVAHAERLISHNTNRQPIHFTSARGRGAHIRTRGFPNEWAEAGWIAKEITRQISAGTPAEDILVLARAAFAYAPVQRALRQAGVMHHVLGSLGLFERSEVKDALAYIQLIQNPMDLIALRRAISHPTRDVGPKRCAAIAAYARAERIDLLQACARQAQIPRLPKRARSHLERFAAQMLEIRAAHDRGARVSETVARTLGIGGGIERYLRWVHENPKSVEDGDAADAALALLKAMRQAARRYEEQAGDEATLLGFVERAVGLHSDGPAIVTDGVGISTIHGAKGMEAPIVFLCAGEEEVTPSRHAIAAGTRTAIEEERSAYYVGMTRAETVLVTTWAGARRKRATLARTRFLDEAGL